MKQQLIVVTTIISLALSAPQPKPQLPAEVDPEIVADIFGNSGFAGGYGGGGEDLSSEPEREAPNSNTVDANAIGVVVNIIKEDAPADYSDYNPSAGEPEDKATVEINAQFETCAEYTDQFGYECVPYYQCHNGTIITDGAGLIDVRNGFGALNIEDSKCPGFLDVCCKDPDFIPPPPPKQTYKPRCGRRNTAGVGARIQGFKADESQFAEWPHMCAVLHDKKDDNGESTNLYKCGGSLIAPGVILTAAHCVKDLKPFPEQLKVRCGEWDTQNQIEPYPHQDRYGADVQIHPEFNPRNLANDFALIFMQEEYNLDYHIDTVCLPQPNTEFNYETCFATGWGKDNFGADGEYQVILKEIGLNVVPKDTCQDKLRTTRLGQKFKLDQSFICAGGEAGKDTCKGDGGSPLVCPLKNDPTHYQQAGIVAWGIGCGENGVPGVYADVSEAACWIDMAMSCKYGQDSGDFNTYWGYEQGQCGTWMEGKLSNLDVQIQGNPRLAKIFEAQKSAYQQCQVNWLTAVVETETGPYTDGNNNNNNNNGGVEVDLGGFERDATNYGSSGVDSGLGGSAGSPEKVVDAASPYSAGGSNTNSATGSSAPNAVVVEVAKEAEPGPVY